MPKTDQAIYDISLTWQENAEKGPFFTGEIPSRVWPEPSSCELFLGYPVASTIGVPAGPLLNSKWIGLAAALGFDIVTYKTIRSTAHPSHALPNILFVDCDGQLKPQTPAETVHPFHAGLERPDKLSITNSFGNPSREREFLVGDIRQARELLHPLQVLIVSVFGTTDHKWSLAEDFARATRIAVEGNAMAVEANLSCPNVKAGGVLYRDPDSVREVGSAVVDAAEELPVIIKVGTFPDMDSLRATLTAAADVGVQAVAGINTISVALRDPEGGNPLGDSRPTTGVCGYAIQQEALKFVRQSAEIIAKEDLPLTLVGGGGIVCEEDFDRFLEAGADAAMTATGMMWDPYLAARHHDSRKLLPTTR